MNYEELKAAILSDSHRQDYATEIERFVAQGEALFGLTLEAFPLTSTLTDAHRTGVDSGVYTLPTQLTSLRYIHDKSTGRPLDLTDESQAYIDKHLTTPLWYVMRPLNVLIVGTPAEASEFTLDYLGLPEPLAEDTDTNDLLSSCPQLYIEAAQVYLFKRMRNFEAAQVALESVRGLVEAQNRKIKKKLGGAKSSNPYNVNFRSAY